MDNGPIIIEYIIKLNVAGEGCLFIEPTKSTIKGLGLTLDKAEQLLHDLPGKVNDLKEFILNQLKGARDKEVEQINKHVDVLLNLEAKVEEAIVKKE